VKGKWIKKIIAPVVVTILIICYLCMVALGIFRSTDSILMKILIGSIPLALIGVIVFVLIERIEEINGGEEDDLSKY